MHYIIVSTQYIPLSLKKTREGGVCSLINLFILEIRWKVIYEGYVGNEDNISRFRKKNICTI
jgi:hypothetical protein